MFHWSMLSAGWNESSRNTLLDMVWVTVRGFSYSSAWIEKYKKDQKNNTEVRRTEEAIVRTCIFVLFVMFTLVGLGSVTHFNT